MVEFFPQNMIMPRVLSDDTATLAAQDLVESLQNPMLNAPLVTTNYTHHTALRFLAELFNIIPKAVEQKSTNINNGRQWDKQEISVKPDQVISPVTHPYPIRQQQHQTLTPRVKTQQNKPGIPPRVAPSEVPI